jgi:hypothetical protein
LACTEELLGVARGPQPIARQAYRPLNVPRNSLSSRPELSQPEMLHAAVADGRNRPFVDWMFLFCKRLVARIAHGASANPGPMIWLTNVAYTGQLKSGVTPEIQIASMGSDAHWQDRRPRLG